MPSPDLEATRSYREGGVPLVLYRLGRKAWNSLPTGLRESLRYGCQYLVALDRLTRRQRTERSVEDVLDTVFEAEPGYGIYTCKIVQLRDEFRTLVDRVVELDPTVVVEIGTHQGGSLYTWARTAKPELLISVDLPGGKFGGGYPKRTKRYYRAFTDAETDVRLLRRDSHEHRTKQKIEAILHETGHDSVDFLFIDGDHSYEGVKRDWEMYGPLVRTDGLVAFHDIVQFPNDPTVVAKRRRDVESLEERHLMWFDEFSTIRVHQFWQELKRNYDSEEIISHPEQTHMGIGMIRK